MKNIVKSLLVLNIGLVYSPCGLWRSKGPEETCSLSFDETGRSMMDKQYRGKGVGKGVLIVIKNSEAKMGFWMNIIPEDHPVHTRFENIWREVEKKNIRRSYESRFKIEDYTILASEINMSPNELNTMREPLLFFKCQKNTLNKIYHIAEEMDYLDKIIYFMRKANLLPRLDLHNPETLPITVDEFCEALEHLFKIIGDPENSRILTSDECEYAQGIILEGLFSFDPLWTDQRAAWALKQFRDGLSYLDEHFWCVSCKGEDGSQYTANLGLSLIVILQSIPDHIKKEVPGGEFFSAFCSIFNHDFTTNVTSDQDLAQKILSKIKANIRPYLSTVEIIN